MIVETLVTTLDRAGRANVAPMGVVWGDAEIVLKPYRDTKTFRNLLEVPEAVVNLVDEVGYYVEAALSSPTLPATPAVAVRGNVLEAACSWRELRVRESELTEARARFVCDVVHRGAKRDFVGFSRARNAVLEATILATRTRILPIAEIQAEYARLQVIVDKTAGTAERDAMRRLVEFVAHEAAILKGEAP